MRTARRLPAAVLALAVLSACQASGGAGQADPAPKSLTGAPTGQKTARSATPSPTGCEEPCTTSPTSTTRGPASVGAPSAGTPGKASASATSAATAPVTAYSRDAFGSGWTDPDHNGCDARQDAIRAATTNRTMAGPCKITQADIRDRYTGRTYPHANPSAFDIDHVVALHDAWNSGAWKWCTGSGRCVKRIAFANDPANLVLTTASANRSKGDQDPSTWAPASHDGACFYVRTYRAIKLRWRLHTTPAQRAAIRRTLATCTGTENR